MCILQILYISYNKLWKYFNLTYNELNAYCVCNLLALITNPRNIFKLSSLRWKRDIGANGADCIRAPSHAKFSAAESGPNTTEINSNHES